MTGGTHVVVELDSLLPREPFAASEAVSETALAVVSSISASSETMTVSFSSWGLALVTPDDPAEPPPVDVVELGPAL